MVFYDRKYRICKVRVVLTVWLLDVGGNETRSVGPAKVDMISRARVFKIKEWSLSDITEDLTNHIVSHHGPEKTGQWSWIIDMFEKGHLLLLEAELALTNRILPCIIKKSYKEWRNLVSDIFGIRQNKRFRPSKNLVYLNYEWKHSQHTVNRGNTSKVHFRCSSFYLAITILLWEW